MTRHTPAEITLTRTDAGDSLHPEPKKPRLDRGQIMRDAHRIARTTREDNAAAPATSTPASSAQKSSIRARLTPTSPKRPAVSPPP